VQFDRDKLVASHKSDLCNISWCSAIADLPSFRHACPAILAAMGIDSQWTLFHPRCTAAISRASLQQSVKSVFWSRQTFCGTAYNTNRCFLLPLLCRFSANAGGKSFKGTPMGLIITTATCLSFNRDVNMNLTFKVKVRIKDSGFAPKDNQGPRPRTSNIPGFC